MSKKKRRAATARHITTPRDLDRWLDRSGQQLVAGDFSGVIATAQRVVQTPIASPQQRADAYDRLGAAHMLLQQHALDQLIAQEELFQKAVQIMAQHHWAEAEPIFHQGIAMGDVLPQPWGNLGICLLMQRQFDAAEAALRRALEIDPDYSIARQNLVALPAIRASGKLPPMRINTAFEGQPDNLSLAFVGKD